MTIAPAEVPMREITAVINELKDKALYTWRRQAQKIALIGWRDSTRYPGALARFEMEAYRPNSYGFARRRSKSRYSALQLIARGAPEGMADQRPFVSSGSLREQIAQRRPISKNQRGGYQGGEVVTRISIDGGALNLLSNKHGYTARHTETEQIIVHQPGHFRMRQGKRYFVRGSDQRRVARRTVYSESPTSFRDEFQIRQADLVDMAKRDAIAFRGVVRGAAFTKSGKLKSSIIAKFNGTEEA